MSYAQKIPCKKRRNVSRGSTVSCISVASPLESDSGIPGLRAKFFARRDNNRVHLTFVRHPARALVGGLVGPDDEIDSLVHCEAVVLGKAAALTPVAVFREKAGNQAMMVLALVLVPRIAH